MVGSPAAGASQKLFIVKRTLVNRAPVNRSGMKSAARKGVRMNMRATMLRILAALGLTMLLAAPGWASALDDAKASGVVGEQANGYLGAVREPVSAEGRALVETINAERRRQYQSIAARNDIRLEQVELLAGRKAIEKTASGLWIRTPDGTWTPK